MLTGVPFIGHLPKKEGGGGKFGGGGGGGGGVPGQFNFKPTEYFFHETLLILIFCLYKHMQENSDFFGLSIKSYPMNYYYFCSYFVSVLHRR